MSDYQPTEVTSGADEADHAPLPEAVVAVPDAPAVETDLSPNAPLTMPHTGTEPLVPIVEPLLVPAPVTIDEPVEVPVDDGSRPWHGAENPLEALYQHFTAALAAVKAKIEG